MSTSTPVKDQQHVRSDGTDIQALINGVKIHYPVSHPDERGELVEMYHPGWAFHPDPLVSAIMITVRPGKVRGWAKHIYQDDRQFLFSGTVKIVLYDDRVGSPTHKMINEIYLSESKRGLVLIPMGVYHAIQNIGNVDAILVNMPSQPYKHADPDKYRLPLENELIPYTTF